ncbi:MAG: hypothetical protein IKT27_06125 [Clostridia bacterium]|nr:hypothetical protein [Clostridia bacterium]
MSKTNRIYKIFMATMIVAIAGMLLAMGIIAAQKTMKLGVQFSSTPNYKLAIAINDAENVVFQNFDDVIMDNGISSLNGNVLVADNNVFKNYGNDFTIIIKNYTESTGIEVAMESTAKIDGGADGIPAQIQVIKNTASKYDPNTKIADSVSFRIYVNSVFPQITTLTVNITAIQSVNITLQSNDTCTISGANTLMPSNSYTATITEANGYAPPSSITVTSNGSTTTVAKGKTVGGITYSVAVNSSTGIETGTIFIASNTISKDATINATSEIWNGKTTTTLTGTTIDSPMELTALDSNLTASVTLTKDLYLNDETFTYLPDSGYVKVTDGVNTAYLGTGVNNTTRGQWYLNTTGTTITSTISGNKCIVQGMSINIWEPLGDTSQNLTILSPAGFNGSINGNGYTIKNIYVNNINNNYMAFVETGDSTSLTNIILTGFICGANYCGGFMGTAVSGNVGFSNCINQAVICGNQYIGGLYGYTHTRTGTNMENKGVVIGGQYVGAIAGESYATESNFSSDCTNIGTVINITNPTSTPLLGNRQWGTAGK